MCVCVYLSVLYHRCLSYFSTRYHLCQCINTTIFLEYRKFQFTYKNIIDDLLGNNVTFQYSSLSNVSSELNFFT